jgi:hypothetical protein
VLGSAAKNFWLKPRKAAAGLPGSIGLPIGHVGLGALGRSSRKAGAASGKVDVGAAEEGQGRSPLGDVAGSRAADRRPVGSFLVFFVGSRRFATISRCPDRPRRPV